MNIGHLSIATPVFCVYCFCVFLVVFFGGVLVCFMPRQPVQLGQCKEKEAADVLSSEAGNNQYSARPTLVLIQGQLWF